MPKISDASKVILKEKLIGMKAKRQELKKQADELNARLAPIEVALQTLNDEIDNIEKDIKDK